MDPALHTMRTVSVINQKENHTWSAAAYVAIVVQQQRLLIYVSAIVPLIRSQQVARVNGLAVTSHCCVIM